MLNNLIECHFFENIFQQIIYHQTESQKASCSGIFQQCCVLVSASAWLYLVVQSSLMFVGRQGHELFVCGQGDYKLTSSQYRSDSVPTYIWIFVWEIIEF